MTLYRPHVWMLTLLTIITHDVFSFTSIPQSTQDVQKHNYDKTLVFSNNDSGNNYGSHNELVHKKQTQQSRGKFISLSSQMLISLTLSSTSLSSNPVNAIDLPFLSKKERIQLELCMISIKRVQYWAMNVVASLKEDNETTSQKRKSVYLEARLGSKALLSKKIGGGGGNLMVITLASFQLRECLEDITYYIASNNELKSKRRQAEDISTNIIESLASIVEFDGLDNTIDPSPRSSLMNSMYNDDKAAFVRKLMEFQLIPNCREIINIFRGVDDGRLMKRVDDYIFNYYPSEIPSSILSSL